MKIFLAVLLFAIAAIGLAPFSKFLRGTPTPASPTIASADDDKRPYVETAHPARKTVYRKLDLPGDLIPNQQVTLYSRVQGYLETISVDRGSFVKKGDVLVRISVPELEKELAGEKADLETFAPSAARDKAKLDWTEAIWKRLDDTWKKTPDLVTRDLLDDARGRYETAKAELDLTRSREPGMRATVERTQAMIDFATIRAPFDGVVTERWVDPGDLIQPATTRMLHLMEMDPLRIRIWVPESDVPFVRGDSLAKIAFDELAGKLFEARVSRESWALNRSTKTLAVEIDLKNPDRRVRPGMFAHVTIELDAHPDALVLPASALVSVKKKAFVFVVEQGIARKTPVKVGADDGIEFEVVDGVKPEDEVIITGKNLVSGGEPVRSTLKRP